MFYIFGYSKGTVFAAMPKIKIITVGKRIKVFNGKKIITNPKVILDFSGNALILKIPLELLNYPDYVLTSLKAYHGNLPIDAVGFRKIKIK